MEAEALENGSVTANSVEIMQQCCKRAAAPK